MIRIVRSTPIEQVKGGDALSESGAELWDIDMPETLPTLSPFVIHPSLIITTILDPNHRRTFSSLHTLV
jgi:hypothetical protein